MKKNGKNGKRRANHCGTLTKKGSSWMARWYVDIEDEFKKDKDGKFVLNKAGLPTHPKKRISLMTGATSLEAARDFLNQKTKEYGLDQPSGLLDRLLMLKCDQEQKKRQAEEKQAEIEYAKPGLLLSEFFKAYKSSPRRTDPSGRTLDDYEAHAKHFIKWLKDTHPDVKEVRHVTPEIAGQYAVHLRDNWSTGTHNKRIVFLRSCWETLATVPSAKIENNPWKGIRNLTSTDVEKKRPFTIEELITVAKVLPQDYKFLFLIGLCTGLRLEDCSLLEWNQVDMIIRKIELEPLKTKRKYHRKVILPIHSALYAALDTIPPSQRTGYVLPAIADAYSREPSLVSNSIQKSIESVGIKTQVIPPKGKVRNIVGFHSLRHFVSTWLQNARVPYAMVEKMLGHSPISMTAYYYHENLDTLRHAIATLPMLAELTWEGLTLPKTNCDTIDITSPATVSGFANAKTEIEKLLGSMSPETLQAALAHLRAQSITFPPNQTGGEPAS